jgi:plasmid stabilization system protein ParE
VIVAVVRLSTIAQADFDEIVEQLSVLAGKGIAKKYARRLQAAINRLVHFPGLGAPRREVGPETRVVIVDPYLIFYDGGPRSAEVLVLRILHGHREITPELIARGRKR